MDNGCFFFEVKKDINIMIHLLAVCLRSLLSGKDKSESSEIFLLIKITWHVQSIHFANSVGWSPGKKLRGCHWKIGLIVPLGDGILVEEVHCLLFWDVHKMGPPNYYKIYKWMKIPSYTHLTTMDFHRVCWGYNYFSIKNQTGSYQWTPFSNVQELFSILRFFRGPFTGSDRWRFP